MGGFWNELGSFEEKRAMVEAVGMVGRRRRRRKSEEKEEKIGRQRS